MAGEAFYFLGREYILHIIDGGWYTGGWTFQLPSHGRCWIDIAVYYKGQH